jgi:serine/threonine protein kinase
MSGCVNQTMSSCVGLCGVLTSWSLNASPRHQREEVILHRDLKPANILLDDKYDVKARAPPGPPPVNPARAALIKTATVWTPPVSTRTARALTRQSPPSRLPTRALNRRARAGGGLWAGGGGELRLARVL